MATTTRPARSRRVNPDIEDEEETTPPPRTTTTRRKTAAVKPVPEPEDEDEGQDEDEADEEEVAPPVKRRSRAAQNDEADVEEDDDEEETAVPFFRGRKAISENRNTANGIYFQWPKEDGEVQVLKFLDEDPWGYNQHWVTRAGKQSFPCLGKGCPLCAVGAKINSKVVYSVLNLSLAEGPTVQAFEVTPTIDDELAAYDADKKTGPLPKLWWSASRTKLAKPKGFAKWNYKFLPIKDRDLEEDYDIDLDEAEAALDGAVGPDPAKVIGTVTHKMLQEIADELMA